MAMLKLPDKEELNMKKYESPSYEVEYFVLKNGILTNLSVENPDTGIDDWIDEPVDGPAPY